MVEKGKVLESAIELARQIASYPQACMRSDRLSMYQQASMPMDEALKNEFQLGKPSLLKEGVHGAAKFKSLKSNL
eukprot:gene2494-2840_t